MSVPKHHRFPVRRHSRAYLQGPAVVCDVLVLEQYSYFRDNAPFALQSGRLVVFQHLGCEGN